MKQAMLTTIDNPFNPFEDYASWDEYDQRQGYHSASFLARLVYTSDDLSDEENQLAIDSAIDEIVAENVLGIYKKVTQA